MIKLIIITAILAVFPITMGSFPAFEFKTLKTPNIALETVVEIYQDTPELVIRRFGAEWADYMVRLAECESKMNPNEINIKTGDYGLFQINLRWNQDVNIEQALNAEWSVKWTLEQLRQGNKWKWNASKKCWN